MWDYRGVILGVFPVKTEAAVCTSTRCPALARALASAAVGTSRHLPFQHPKVPGP